MTEDRDAFKRLEIIPEAMLCKVSICSLSCACTRAHTNESHEEAICSNSRKTSKDPHNTWGHRPILVRSWWENVHMQINTGRCSMWTKQKHTYKQNTGRYTHANAIHYSQTHISRCSTLQKTVHTLPLATANKEIGNNFNSHTLHFSFSYLYLRL